MIHSNDRIPALLNTEVKLIEVSALEMMQHINQGAEKEAIPFSRAFREESAARADDMRMANALREEGKSWEGRDINRSRKLKGHASQIESDLRKPGGYER